MGYTNYPKKASVPTKAPIKKMEPVQSVATINIQPQTMPGVGNDGTVTGNVTFNPGFVAPAPVKENTVEFPIVSRVSPTGLKSIESQAYFAVCKETTLEIDILKTNRFLLQSINKPLMERFQITEVFNAPEKYQGEPSISFFGSRTKVYTLNGIVYSALAEKYLWDEQLRRFYDQYFRATKLVETKCIGKLAFSDNTWYGYPISLSFVDDATNPNMKQFSMQWIIEKEYVPFTNIASIFKDPRKLIPEEEKIRGAMKKIEEDINVLTDEIYKMEVNAMSNETTSEFENTLITKKNKRKTLQAEYKKLDDTLTS